MIRSKGALNRPLDKPIFPEPDFTKEDNIILICYAGTARINQER